MSDSSPRAKILSKYKDKKCLLTGATGFWGKNMVPILQEAGAEITALGSYNADLTDLYETETVFNDGCQYDYIFHGAAVQGAGEYPLKFPAEQFDLNIRIHTNVLKAWAEHQPQARFVGIESTCSYPGNIVRLPESVYWDGPMHDSVNFYGFTKKCLHTGLEAYKKQYNLRGVCATFATLFGKHDSFDPDKAHVVSALIKRFADAVINEVNDVEVWGDGLQTRELIHVEDQCLGLLLVADDDSEDGIINIGTGVQVTIGELAEIIARATGYTGRINYNTNRFVGVRHKVLDITRAKEKYGWTTTVPVGSLVDRIKETVDWYFEKTSTLGYEN